MKTSPEIQQKIIELTISGLSHESVAKQLKIAKNTVIKYLKQNNVIGNYNKQIIEITPELLKEIQEYYDLIGNVKKVAKKFHISSSRLRRYIIYKKPKKCKSIKANPKDTYYKNKTKLIEYKGGKCQICGYNKCQQALEFHHIDPKTKEFNISGGTKSLERLKKETDKCILVCSNCHKEIHAGLISINDFI